MSKDAIRRNVLLITVFVVLPYNTFLCSLGILKLLKTTTVLVYREYGCFPVKDPNGYQVIFHRLHVFEPKQYVFNDGVKLLSMAIDACLNVEGTVPG